MPSNLRPYGLHDAAVAYDAYAPRYDNTLRENRINAYMRRVMSAILLSTFPAPCRLIELGCGTGDEALMLAGQGAEVVAFDASAEMLRIAKAKAASRGLGHKVLFLRGAARDIASLADQLRGRFDGGYASFSLAYEPDLRPVAQGLSLLLPRGALLVTSVPSRLCLVELAVSFAAGRPSFAGRRLRPVHGHKVGAYVVPVRSYTPHSLSLAMAPSFRLLRWEGLPVLVPPPYMNKVYAHLKGFADALEKADPFFGRRFPFRSVGDHLVAFFRRS